MRTAILFIGVSAIACGGEGCGVTPAVCNDGSTDTDGQSLGGAWDDLEDWSDPGLPGNDIAVGQTACGFGSESAHHCFTTAVHAIHMHTGQVMLFHGEADQRVWDIGSAPESINWHPNLLSVSPTGVLAHPDMFCTGHAQLGDGRVFFAGGNIDGNPQSGGIRDTFLFDPVGATAAVPGSSCGFGWQHNGPIDAAGHVRSTAPRMAHDRWYPTLTTLRDGRVLISAGWSRATLGAGGPCTADADCGPGLTCTLLSNTCDGAANSGLLEVYDPTNNSVQQLSSALFPVEGGVPAYPLMFLLPNGDVFYAGSEEAGTPEQAHGRFLVIEYDEPPADWTWSEERVRSEISGGSAAMYEPGKILKSGGLVFGSNLATNEAEIVNLAGFDSGQYEEAPPRFESIDPMHRRRHFHNLTILPDGRVLATGGNTRGNGDLGDNPNNPCRTPGGLDLDERPCDLGCPSTCIDLGGYYEAFAQPTCETLPSELGCSALAQIRCDADAAVDECSEILEGAYCNGTRCAKDCTFEGEDCGMMGAPGAPGSSSVCSTGAAYGGACDPGNNACFASKAAEIFDPACGTWTELQSQDFPRMYHSSALLMPDGRVLSMGGGHRVAVADQVVSEYFQPEYSFSSPSLRPELSVGNDPVLTYGQSSAITVSGEPARGFSLVKLGSSTHGFDMDQRFIQLQFVSDGTDYLVFGPDNAGEAPPGYYMLFGISASGQPSVGEYVRVGP